MTTPITSSSLLLSPPRLGLKRKPKPISWPGSMASAWVNGATSSRQSKGCCVLGADLVLPVLDVTARTVVDLQSLRHKAKRSRGTRIHLVTRARRPGPSWRAASDLHGGRKGPCSAVVQSFPWSVSAGVARQASGKIYSYRFSEEVQGRPCLLSGLWHWHEPREPLALRDFAGVRVPRRARLGRRGIAWSKLEALWGREKAKVKGRREPCAEGPKTL